MANIDLIHCVPERLAEEADLNDLLQTIRSIEQWQERHAEVLDYIYRMRLIRLLTRRSSEEGLRELADHLDRVTHPRRSEDLNSLARPYGERWSVYKDILENRLAALRSSAPEQVLKKAHVEQILDLVTKGGVTKQNDLQKTLGLKSANLTRILNLMEANDLIERRTIGREKRIETGPNGERFRDKKTEAVKPQRWASVFRIDKAVA